MSVEKVDLGTGPSHYDLDDPAYNRPADWSEFDALAADWEECCDQIDKFTTDERSNGESRGMRVCAKELREFAKRAAMHAEAPAGQDPMPRHAVTLTVQHNADNEVIEPEITFAPQFGAIFDGLPSGTMVRLYHFASMQAKPE